MRRRGGRRQQPGSTPADVGTTLREAREAANIGLAELQDRTGVALAHLQALEAGDLSLFPDLRTAVTAVRRYSDLVELDGTAFVGVVESHWGAPVGGAAAPGAGSAKAPTQSVYLGAPASVGHLSRYPGDGTHLRAFTQTDEVPGVRRATPAAGNGHGNGHGPARDGNGSFPITGSFPAVPTMYAPARVPLLLRGAIWLTVTLLVIALGGLALQHYQPQLLADIHLVHHPGAATPGTPGSTGHSTTPAPPAHASAVSLTDTGAGSATVSVRASSYTVVVAAWARCWTVVHTPQNFAPIFAATMPGGQVKDFNSSNGQLTVSMSASLVTVQVKIDGKIVPKWLFKPTSVPFTLNFNSTTS